MLKGVAASSGIGMGRAFVYILPDIPLPLRCHQGTAAELHRLEGAVEEFCAQISRLAEFAAGHFGRSEAGILISQMVMVQDSELWGEIARQLEHEPLCAEQAVCFVFDAYIRHFEGLQNERMRARAADLKDAKRRLLSILTGEAEPQNPPSSPGEVLVAAELPPSAAAALLPRGFAAMATADGSSTSHLAILARALAIPAVVAVPQLLNRIAPGDELIVNGDAGEILLRPTAREAADYLRRGRTAGDADKLLL